MRDNYIETPIFNRHEDKLVVKRVYDNAPILEKATALHNAGLDTMGDNKVAGVLPMYMVTEWMKEAGLAHDDNEGRKEVIKRKMLSGEFDKFRVWKGSW